MNIKAVRLCKIKNIELLEQGVKDASPILPVVVLKVTLHTSNRLIFVPESFFRAGLLPALRSHIYKLLQETELLQLVDIHPHMLSHKQVKQVLVKIAITHREAIALSRKDKGTVMLSIAADYRTPKCRSLNRLEELLKEILTCGL